MDGSTQAQPTQLRFDTLVSWLCTGDPQQRNAATTIFCREGKLSAELLVQEAIRPGKRSQHLIAILDVVRQIGGPLGPSEMFGLQSLLRHRDLAVRQKAERLIMEASPCGLPDAPETVALMRALNPLLRPLPPHRPPRRTRLSDFAAALRGDRAAARRRVRSSAAREKREERERGPGT